MNLTKFIVVFIIIICIHEFCYADSVSFYLENDFLEKMPDSSTSDGYYSAGESIQYESDKNWGLRLKSQIYTPSDKDSDQPDYSDRPYCGLLYGEYFKKTYCNNYENLYTIGLGVVGPASGGEWLQTEFHKLIKSKPPMGWKYQIYNEPVVQIGYYRTYSLFLNKYIEFRPYAGANLGNYLINAELGNVVRAGWNLPKNFDPVIRSTPRGNFWNNIYAYGFVGGKAYGVARNMSLDGNTFKESIVTVDKEYVVGDGLIGICIGIYNFEITATHIERTHEFQTQTRDSRFDSFQIRWQF